MQNWMLAVGGYAFVSIVTFVVYGFDKRRKLSYMLVFLGIVGLHAALWIAWYRLTR